MLISKIKEKKACVGVVGLGYVGLPLILEFAKAGFPVTGLDIDKGKIEQLSQGKSYIHHIPTESIRRLNADCRFQTSTDFFSDLRTRLYNYLRTDSLDRKP